MAILFVLLVGVAILTVRAALNYQHQEQIEQNANCDEQDGDSAVMLEQMDGFQLRRNPGYCQRCKICLTGEKDGVPYSLFEYSYKIGSARQERIFPQTVALFRSDDVIIPDFNLQPIGYGILGRLGSFHQFNEMKLDREFSKKFTLSSVEPVKTRDLFTTHIRNLAIANRLSVESYRGKILIYRTNIVVPDRNLERFLKTAQQFVAQMRMAVLSNGNRKKKAGKVALPAEMPEFAATGKPTF